MNLEEITEQDFAAYENVRESGVCNMLDKMVEDLAGISKDVHLGIIKHYEALCEKFPHIRTLA